MVDLICSLGSIEVPKRLRKIRRHWIWTPPASGHIKMNIDGSYICVSSRGGIGCGFKDSKGKVLL